MACAQSAWLAVEGESALTFTFQNLNFAGYYDENGNKNGLSRILVGIHFRNAVEEGAQHGRKIGRRAVNRFMRPVR